MHKTLEEAITLASEIKKGVSGAKGVDIVLGPSFICLKSVNDVIAGSNVDLAAQNFYWEKEGAFTGEVSSSMLLSVGCKYVIIGHSERRQYFGETNDTVNRKLKAALEAGLLPIMCVGEKLEEREAGKTFEVVRDHVEKGLTGISESLAEKVVIAYEPVWAIGTGKNATPGQAQEVHKFIREILKKIYKGGLAEKVRIQYGGSVKPDNAESLMAMPDIDGGLVGGASLKAESFCKLVKAAESAKSGD
jgi:triosephosphate isomerase (TIM)